MTDEVRKEIFSRMDAITTELEESMSYEQLKWFMEGYTYCREQMMDIVEDTYEHLNPKKQVSRVPGIFCMNSKCEHYFEDSCLLFFNEQTIDISKDGKCDSFKEGMNEAYKLTEEE